jgi:hypothetical protein
MAESIFGEQHSRNQNRADGGVGRGPGGPPHKSSQTAKIFRSSSTNRRGRYKCLKKARGSQRRGARIVKLTFNFRR